MLPLALCFFALQAIHAQEGPLPPLKYLEQLSWRKQPSQYDLSGWSTVLASTQDYLRLVPDQPLAFGGAFSRQTMPAKEFIVDVAFRVHADAAENSQHRAGGRGMGIWYTKGANPTEVTIDADGHAAGNLPSLLRTPQYDADVSLFGNKAPFEGLGIIFDSSPSIPLQRRSDNSTYHRHAADDLGVVAGIMDDSSSDWLESAVVTPGKEAKYLQNAVGDCAAKYRNSNGLIWARLSHYDHKISLHLDMSPHSTLSMADRQFRNPCFTIDGVALPAGYHIGITGLASANPVPDAIDVYAVEVWEVLPRGKADEYQDRLRTDAQQAEAPLAGTEQDELGDLKMMQELVKAQATILERVEALSAKVDRLLNQAPAAAGAGTAKEAPRSSNTDEQYLIQQIQKVAGQLTTLHAMVDSFQSKTSGTLSVVTSRMGETFGLLHRTSEQLLSASAGSKASTWTALLYVAVVALAGVVGTAIYRVARKGGLGGKGKKMI